MLCCFYAYHNDAMTIIAPGRGQHSESIGMTEKFEDTISVPNEQFVSFMEELLKNEAITKLDITYYVSGGCNLKAYVGASEKKYYVYDKPANKTGRFNGEMGWLLSDRQDVTSTHTKSHDWVNYIIERIEDEATPDATAEVVSAPAPDGKPREKYIPSWNAKSEESANDGRSALAIVLHELAQPQVEVLSLVLRPDLNKANINIIAFDNGNIGLAAGFTHHSTLKSTQEAVEYILGNAKYFMGRFVCSLDATKDSEGTVNSLTIKRHSDMEGVSMANRENYLDNYLFLNDHRGYWNIEDFLKNQLTDKKVSSIEICKNTDLRPYRLNVKVGKAIVPYYLSADDFTVFNEYLQDNLYEIMWDGFSVKYPEYAKDDAIEIVIQIARQASADSEDGFLITNNVPLFVHEFLEDCRDYELHLSVGKGMVEYASISTFDAVTNVKTTFDVKSPIEEVKEFITWIKGMSPKLGTSYLCDIECMDDDSWGYSVKIRKNIRFSWDWYIKDGKIDPTAVQFLTKAYNAGISISVLGGSKSGKTSFLSTLVENAKDTKLSVFTDSKAEIRIPDTVENVVVIAGSANHSLNAALKISPERIIFDTPETDERANFFKRATGKGIQLIMAANNTSHIVHEYSRVSEAGSPFEIEVLLSKSGTVETIRQLTYSKKDYSATVLWTRTEDGVFGPNPKNDGPSRNLRRKIEAGASATMSLNDYKVLNNFASAVENPKFVTIPEREKNEILSALETLTKFVQQF